MFIKREKYKQKVNKAKTSSSVICNFLLTFSICLFQEKISEKDLNKRKPLSDLPISKIFILDRALIS